MQLRRERDRLRHKMDMFKKTLSSELLTMQLKGSNSSDSMYAVEACHKGID